MKRESRCEGYESTGRPRIYEQITTGRNSKKRHALAGQCRWWLCSRPISHCTKTVCSAARRREKNRRARAEEGVENPPTGRCRKRKPSDFALARSRVLVLVEPA